MKAAARNSIEMTPQPAEELLVCAISFYTATEGDRYYQKNHRYRADETGPRIKPKWFLPSSKATDSALVEIENRVFDEKMARADRMREETERKMRPTPPKVFEEHEFFLCIKQVGVEATGGRAPSRLMLIGTLVSPDNAWVSAAPKCFRSVLPKGAKPEECLVCTETHGPGQRRIYAGEFVRRDDPRVAINEHIFREPRKAPGQGFTTFNTYMTESTPV